MLVSKAPDQAQQVTFLTSTFQAITRPGPYFHGQASFIYLSISQLRLVCHPHLYSQVKATHCFLCHNFYQFVTGSRGQSIGCTGHLDISPIYGFESLLSPTAPPQGCKPQAPCLRDYAFQPSPLTTLQPWQLPLPSWKTD